MQLYSRLSIHRPQKKGAERTKRMSSSRGCEGVQDPNIQAQEEAGGSSLPIYNNSGNRPQNLCSKEIINRVSELTNIPVLLLQSSRRGKMLHISKVRHVLCLLCHDLTYETSSQIGRNLHKDHTTIMNGIKRGKVLVATEAKYEALYNMVCN